MRQDIPDSIQESLHELNPTSLVTLYEIHLSDGTSFHLSPARDVLWLGVQYDEIPCHLTEIQNDADGKLSRPKFSFANPGGMFSSAIAQGLLDNAVLYRKRVSTYDLENNLDFSLKERYQVAKVMSVSNSIAVVELRGVLDAPRFKLPARSYYPPEFPHVKLQ